MVLLALLFLPIPVLAAGDAALDRATLAGLKTLNVVVDEIHPELERQGLTKDALQTELEDRLQEANIAVDKNAPEFLGVRIMPARQKKGPYSISVALGVYQPVRLVRDQKIRTATQTWEVESLWVIEPKVLVRSSMNAVGRLTDRFVEAYRAANPE
jgi:hypothetical protein